MKHTQGKWEILGFSDGVYVTTRTAHIAKIEHIHPDPLQTEYKANAGLIAAAPELLAACKDVERFGFTYCTDPITESYRVSIPSETYNDIKQAIEKAESEGQNE